MFSEFRESLEKQGEGTPIHIGRYTFYCRRWGTPESMRERKKLAQRLFGPLHQHTEEDDSLLLAHWLAEYGVTGWEDEQGELPPWSKDNARDAFIDPEMYLSLNNLLFVECCKYENYLHDQIEESVDEIKKP